MRKFREEVQEEFKEVKSMIKFSYAELDHRIRTLEGEVTDLKIRMERLETRWA
jgi:predicted nuclease with TOPRIM domain